MGFTIRQGQLSKGVVRRDMDNYETNSLDDNMIVNGKSVKDRKRRREYIRDLTQRKRDMNQDKNATMTKEAPKQAGFVDNNEQIKQAAWLKLASIRLAINYVMRNRLMSKQAATPFSAPMQNMAKGVSNAFGSAVNNFSNFASSAMKAIPQATGSVAKGISQASGTAMNPYGRATPKNVPNYVNVGGYTLDPSMNNPRGNWATRQPQPQFDMAQQPKAPQTRKEYTAQLKKQLGLQGPNIAWNKNTGSYDLGGMSPEEARQAVLEERDRITGAWNQMKLIDRDRYQKAYDKHMNTINSWLAENSDPASEIMEDPTAGGEGNYTNDSGARGQDVHLPPVEPPTGEVQGMSEPYWNLGENFNTSIPEAPVYNPYGPVAQRPGLDYAE